MKRDNRVRRQIRFLLDKSKEQERVIGSWLENLKANRQQKPTILKALVLYKALLAGDTSALKKEFPAVVSKLEHERVDKKDNDIGLEVVALMARQTQIMQQLSSKLN